MGTAPDSRPAKVRADRPAGSHQAMGYVSSTDLVAGLAPRVGDAVTAGHSVTAVLDDESGRRLRSALGRAAHEVSFPDPREVHAVPGFTTAVRWARTGRQAATSGRQAMIIGQQLLELPGCGPEYWARLCLGLEVAAAGLPLTVLCPFPDGAATPTRIGLTHQVLAGSNGSGRSPDYRPPHEVVRTFPAPPLLDLGPPAAELRFRGTDLGELRHLTAGIAGRAGLETDRVADVVLAVNELASNSIEHGPGIGRLRMWIDAGMLAEVSDTGRMADPFPGMLPPSPGSPRGRGLWLASELCDVMEVWSDHGTVVRLGWRR